MFNSSKDNYTYDNRYRLTTANYGDGLSQTYTFDPMGNRTQLSETANSTTTSTGYAFDNANRLTSKGGQSVVSDPNGNIQTDGVRANTWDSENRLVSCVKGTQTSAFTYGADGLRRTMTVSDTATPANNLSKTFLLDNGMQVAERQKTGTAATTAPSSSDPLSVTYLQGARGPECVRDETSGTVRWYMTDGLGSVLGEVLPSGAVDGKRKLDVYGVDRGKTGTLKSSQGFVGSLGHQTDDSTGLVYMRARYYDSNTGRFVSEDPGREGSNWFTYGAGNPVNNIDANGRNVMDVIFVFMTVTFGLVVAFELFTYITAKNQVIANLASQSAIRAICARAEQLGEVGQFVDGEENYLSVMYKETKALELDAQRLNTIIGSSGMIAIYAVCG